MPRQRKETAAAEEAVREAVQKLDQEKRTEAALELRLDAARAEAAAAEGGHPEGQVGGGKNPSLARGCPEWAALAPELQSSPGGKA
eukprot:10701755-Lingulodinium_polyedra.AAC.1